MFYKSSTILFQNSVNLLRRNIIDYSSLIMIIINLTFLNTISCEDYHKPDYTYLNQNIIYKLYMVKYI